MPEAISAACIGLFFYAAQPERGPQIHLITAAMPKDGQPCGSGWEPRPKIKKPCSIASIIMKIKVEQYGRELCARHISDQDPIIKCPICNHQNRLLFTDGDNLQMCEGNEVVSRIYRRKCMIIFRKELT